MTAPQAHKMPNASMLIRKADLIAVAKGDTTIDYRLTTSDSFTAACQPKSNDKEGQRPVQTTNDVLSKTTTLSTDNSPKGLP